MDTVGQLWLPNLICYDVKKEPVFDVFCGKLNVASSIVLGFVFVFMQALSDASDSLLPVIVSVVSA